MVDLSDFRFEADLARAGAAIMPARWYLAPGLLGVGKEKIFVRTWQVAGWYG